MTADHQTRVVKWACGIGLALVTLPFALALLTIWDYWQLREREMGFCIAAGLVTVLGGLFASRWKAVLLGALVALMCADGYLWPHVLGML